MGLWRVNFFGAKPQVNTAICLCITNSEQTLKIAMRVVYKPLFWSKNRVITTGYPQRRNLEDSIDFWAETGVRF